MEDTNDSSIQGSSSKETNKSNGKVTDKNNKLINKLMMPVEKATKKIIKGIRKKKKAIVMGFDGRFMSIFSRLFPNFTPSIIAKVLKASNLELFDGVFEENAIKRQKVQTGENKGDN